MIRSKILPALFVHTGDTLALSAGECTQVARNSWPPVSVRRSGGRASYAITSLSLLSKIGVIQASLVTFVTTSVGAKALCGKSAVARVWASAATKSGGHSPPAADGAGRRGASQITQLLL